MVDRNELRQHLHDEIEQTHQRFVEIMSARLADVDSDELERYFAILSKLVSKLEDEEKTLREVAKEMVAESAGAIMAELAKG